MGRNDTKRRGLIASPDVSLQAMGVLHFGRFSAENVPVPIHELAGEAVFARSLEIELTEFSSAYWICSPFARTAAV